MGLKLGRGICAAGMLLLASCVTLQHPLDPPEAAVLDERLVGPWVVDEFGGEVPEEGETPRIVYLAVAGDEYPENFLLGAFVGPEERTGLEAHCAAVYSSQVGERWFLNLPVRQTGGETFTKPPQWGEAPIAWHTLHEYEVHDNELLFFPIDDEKLAEAFERGDLAGDISTRDIPLTNCTSSSEELRDYIAAGHDLFAAEPIMRLHRAE